MVQLKENILVTNNNKVIFNSNTGDNFIVNEIGLEIIEKIQKQEPLDSISNYLASKYEISQAIIKADMVDFISLLNSYDLLENE